MVAPEVGLASNGVPKLIRQVAGELQSNAFESHLAQYVGGCCSSCTSLRRWPPGGAESKSQGSIGLSLTLARQIMSLDISGACIRRRVGLHAGSIQPEG